MTSDPLKLGPQNAPHRALYHALGLTEEEISRPLVGVVSSYNEIVPGHMNIDKIVDAVKLGVAMAGCLFPSFCQPPFPFPETITQIGYFCLAILGFLSRCLVSQLPQFCQ